MSYKLICAALCALILTLSGRAGGQQRAPQDSLFALIDIAASTNPSIRAASDLVTAAQARVRSAGARPDPMLMLGAINVPVRTLSQTDDDMTMRMIGIEQNIPYPGKLGLRRRIAELEVAAARFSADTVRLAVVRDLKTAWYELSYIDEALSIARRNETLLANVANVSRARYASGSGTQQEVLRSTLEATRLNESANALIESRRATAARINELLDRSADAPVPVPVISAAILRAAIDSGSSTRFVSRDLGSPVASSPLPSLAELQAFAVELNPDVRARAAMVKAREVEVELAKKEHLPDVDFSLQYGQRSGYMVTPHGARTPRSDMISAVVSLPIPVQRRNKQSAEAAATRATLSNTQLELRASENRVRTDVARIYSDISHRRTLLALLVNAVMPRAHASVDATMGDYQSGRGDLTSVLAARASLFELEVSLQRALVDFAQKVAELEAIVGKELIS